MRKFQIAVSPDLCISLTWNLTGSCGQQQRLRGWSLMVLKQFQDGGRPPFWKSIYRHNLCEKSNDFHEILYSAADLELDERHVIKKWKICIRQTEFERTYFLFYVCVQLLQVTNSSSVEESLRRFVLLNISLSHSRWLQVIKIGTLE